MERTRTPGTCPAGRCTAHEMAHDVVARQDATCGTVFYESNGSVPTPPSDGAAATVLGVLAGGALAWVAYQEVRD